MLEDEEEFCIPHQYTPSPPPSFQVEFCTSNNLISSSVFHLQVLFYYWDVTLEKMDPLFVEVALVIVLLQVNLIFLLYF